MFNFSFKKIVSKTTILALVILSFSACSFANINNYNKEKKQLVFYNKNQKIKTLKLTNPEQSYYNTSKCVQSSFTIKEQNQQYGKLFFEYIDLDSSCNWTGLPNSFFETSLNQELKLNSFEVVENIDINNYTFKTYKINNNSFLSAIYFYYGSTNMFLLDYKGEFYTKLLKKLNKNSNSKFLNQKRFKKNYDKSLVRKNILENYFSYDKELLN